MKRSTALRRLLLISLLALTGCATCPMDDMVNDLASLHSADMNKRIAEAQRGR